MRIKIVKTCVDGLTHKTLRAGDIVEMTKEHFYTIPIGYAIRMDDEPNEKRTAENAAAKTRTKRTKK